MAEDETQGLPKRRIKGPLSQEATTTEAGVKAENEKQSKNNSQQKNDNRFSSKTKWPSNIIADYSFRRSVKQPKTVTTTSEETQTPNFEEAISDDISATNSAKKTSVNAKTLLATVLEIPANDTAPSKIEMKPKNESLEKSTISSASERNYGFDGTITEPSDVKESQSITRGYGFNSTTFDITKQISTNFAIDKESSSTAVPEENMLLTRPKDELTCSSEAPSTYNSIKKLATSHEDTSAKAIAVETSERRNGTMVDQQFVTQTDFKTSTTAITTAAEKSFSVSTIRNYVDKRIFLEKNSFTTPSIPLAESATTDFNTPSNSENNAFRLLSNTSTPKKNGKFIPNVFVVANC